MFAARLISLDLSPLPPGVVTILMQRGIRLPPLQWHLNPNRPAERKLAEIVDDCELLGCDPLADAGMAAAVRALLYFWNGWPAEACQCAQTAPEKERTFVSALVARQAGEAAGSKSLFQKMNGHPIFKPLRDFAAGEIGLSVAPGLKRLRELIAFGELWEPYAFGDVYEETRAGKFDPAGERVVHSLQCREFELLLIHCLEAATGQELEK
jgi:hypothetical protein